jgi:hypothetical protein
MILPRRTGLPVDRIMDNLNRLTKETRSRTAVDQKT